MNSCTALSFFLSQEIARLLSLDFVHLCMLFSHWMRSIPPFYKVCRFRFMYALRLPNVRNYHRNPFYPLLLLFFLEPSTINSNLTFGLSPVVSNSKIPKRLSPCHCRWMGMSVSGCGMYCRAQGQWKNDRGEMENSMTDDEPMWGDVGGGGNNVVANA